MNNGAALFLSSLVTLGAATGILGVRWLITDFISKAYCVCGHEFNEHIVYPRGMVNPVSSEKCELCGCKQYNKNPKDKRNT